MKLKFFRLRLLAVLIPLLGLIPLRYQFKRVMATRQLIALDYPRTESVLRLIERGANVNARDGENTTVLCLFIQNYSASLPAMELLIKAGADIEARDSFGQTAFMVAVDRGNPNVVNMLLKHGANVNARDNRGYTPLGYLTHPARCCPGQKGPHFKMSPETAALAARLKMFGATR